MKTGHAYFSILKLKLSINCSDFKVSAKLINPLSVILSHLLKVKQTIITKDYVSNLKERFFNEGKDFRTLLKSVNPLSVKFSHLLNQN